MTDLEPFFGCLGACTASAQQAPPPQLGCRRLIELPPFAEFGFNLAYDREPPSHLSEVAAPLAVFSTFVRLVGRNVAAILQGGSLESLQVRNRTEKLAVPCYHRDTLSRGNHRRERIERGAVLHIRAKT
jgi:hypothetical protein